MVSEDCEKSGFFDFVVFFNGYFVHAAYTEQLVVLIICEVIF